MWSTKCDGILDHPVDIDIMGGADGVQRLLVLDGQRLLVFELGADDQGRPRAVFEQILYGSWRPTFEDVLADGAPHDAPYFRVGCGAVDRTGLTNPSAVAVVRHTDGAGSGMVVVTDTTAHRMLMINDLGERVLEFGGGWHGYGFHGYGPRVPLPSDSQVSHPISVAVDLHHGEIAVLGMDGRILVFDSEGCWKMTKHFIGCGAGDKRIAWDESGDFAMVTIGIGHGAQSVLCGDRKVGLRARMVRNGFDGSVDFAGLDDLCQSSCYTGFLKDMYTAALSVWSSR